MLERNAEECVTDSHERAAWEDTAPRKHFPGGVAGSKGLVQNKGACPEGTGNC